MRGEKVECECVCSPLVLCATVYVCTWNLRVGDPLRLEWGGGMAIPFRGRLAGYCKIYDYCVYVWVETLALSFLSGR